MSCVCGHSSRNMWAPEQGDRFGGKRDGSVTGSKRRMVVPKRLYEGVSVPVEFCYDICPNLLVVMRVLCYVRLLLLSVVVG